jgi:F-type H+-transporting ATPase subunit delta
MSKVSRRVLARTIAAKLVAEPARQDYWLKVLAAYLVDQNRAAEADLISNDIAHELFEQSGQLLVHVDSARPLGENVRASLRDLLQAQTGAKRVILAEQVDPALLGGLIARTPSAQIDVSVRTKLKQLATIQ